MNTARTRKCCVEGCKDVISKRHRFPKNNPSLFKMWVDIIKPKDWQILSVLEIYNRYLVCHVHFEEHYHLVGSRRGLTINAVPTLGVPGVDISSSEPSTSEMQREISEPEESRITMEVATQKSVSNDFDALVSQPSTSRSNIPEVQPEGYPSSSETHTREIDIHFHNYCKKEPVSSFREKQDIRISSGKRRSVLLKLNCTRRAQLNPREQILYNMIGKLKKELKQKKYQLKTYQERLDTAQKLVSSEGVRNLLSRVNEASFNFIQCQIRNQTLQQNARRFTLDEKILALALYKASPKGYRLLYKLFCLPSSRTLSRLLETLTFNPGLNGHIFEQLKQTVSLMRSHQDRVCALIFDEISLSTNLKYDRVADMIIGMEDDGTERKARLVDHANVFFLKGLYRQYKQPLAFTFSKGPISSLSLKNMIKTLIEQCQNIGLNVIATICDQGTNNQAAIKSLIEDRKAFCLQSGQEDKYLGFLVNNKEIVPLFDTPHLFKGLRNNLLTKSAHFFINGEKKIAKWSHIQKFYNLNISDPDLRINNKLTDAHVNPQRMNKMKVKLCTQVFSYSVGSMMKLISRWEIKHPDQLAPEAADTGDLLLFLDELFDSLNVSKLSKSAKPMKRPVNNSSGHDTCWENAIRVLDSMKFYCSKKKRLVVVPSIKNLIETLKAFIYLRKKLLHEYKFKYVLTGAFNQDCLENFFGNIRAHGVRNTNPDVEHFIASFKTLVVNNFLSVHSVGYNCEEDKNKSYCLDNLKSFLTNETVDTPSLQVDSRRVMIPRDIIMNKKTKLSKCTLMYMSGAICKIILKKKSLKNCQYCKNNLLNHSENINDSEFIQSRKYRFGNLVKPGQYINFLFSHSFNKLFYLIPRLCERRGISEILQNELKSDLNFQILKCSLHPLDEILCSTIVRCSLLWWCQQVNRILNGKDSRFSRFLLLNPNKDFIDPIKVQAKKQWDKKRSRKNRRIHP